MKEASSQEVKLNANAVNLLRDVYEAYCVTQQQRPGGSKIELGVRGWETFCSDCELVGGNLTLPALRKIFEEEDKDGRGLLSFESFLRALSAVSDNMFEDEDDAMSRLVYFKVIKFGRLTRSSGREKEEGEEEDEVSWDDSRFSFRAAPSEESAQLLKQHLECSKESAKLSTLGPLLVGAYLYYKGSSPLLSLQGMVQICFDLGIVPSLLSYTQVQARFRAFCSSSPPEPQGLNYVGMMRCLRACADSAFRGDPSGKDSTTMLVERMISPPMLSREVDKPRSYFAMESRKVGGQLGVSRQDEEEEREKGRRAREAGLQLGGDSGSSGQEEGEDKELERALQRLEEELKRQMDELASKYAEKEVGIKRQREAARKQLEEECAMKLLESESRLYLNLSKFHPSQQLLDLKSKARALQVAKHASASERIEVEEEVRVRETEEREKFREKVRMEHQVLHARVKMEVEKAKTRFEEETQSLQGETLALMETDFQSMRQKYETKRAALQQLHARSKTSEASKFAFLSAIAEKSKGRKTSVPPLDLHLKLDSSHANQLDSSRRRGGGGGGGTQRSARSTASQPSLAPTTPRARQKAGGGRRATEMLQRVLREIFDNVLEAFVFLDMDGSDCILRYQLARQMQRIAPHVSFEQVMVEVDGKSSNNSIPLLKFVQHFSWPDGIADRQREYEKLKLNRREVLAKFERWRRSKLDEVTNAFVAKKPAGTVEAKRAESKTIMATSPRPPPSCVDDSSVSSCKVPDLSSSSSAFRAKSAPRERPSQSKLDRLVRGEEVSRRGARGAHDGDGGETRRKAWVSDAVRDAEVKKLEREKRKLAVQLLDAERKLALASSAAAAEGDEAKGSLSSSRRHSSRAQARSPPPFVGPKGAYKEEKSVAMFEEGAANFVVSKTGLWAPVPRGAAEKSNEEDSKMPRPGDGEEREAAGMKEVRPQQGVGGGAGEERQTASHPPLAALASRQDDWLDTCIQMISGFVGQDLEKREASQTEERYHSLAQIRPEGQGRVSGSLEEAISFASDQSPSHLLADHPTRSLVDPTWSPLELDQSAPPRPRPVEMDTSAHWDISPGSGDMRASSSLPSRFQAAVAEQEEEDQVPVASLEEDFNGYQELTITDVLGERRKEQMLPWSLDVAMRATIQEMSGDLEQAEDAREQDKPHGHNRQQVAARAGKEEETASHIARKQAWFKKKLMADSSESEDEDREKHRREEEKPRARTDEDEDDSSEEEHEELMSRVLGKSNKVEQEEAKRTNHRDVAANFIKALNDDEEEDDDDDEEFAKALRQGRFQAVLR